VTEIGRTTAEALCRQSESRILPPLRTVGVATDPEDSNVVANFDPEFETLVSKFEVEMGYRTPPDSAKYAATSASFAASDSASNDISESSKASI
jgi:hypothetical protein